MKHPFQVGLTVILAVTSPLGAILPSACAQPRLEVRRMDPRLAAEAAVPPAQVESINAEARTVSLRAFKIAPGTAPQETPEGGVQIQIAAGDLEVVPLAAGAPIVRIESALTPDALKIGDRVSLLGQKVAPGQVKITRGNVEPLPFVEQPVPAILQNLGGARYGSKAEFFRVVALQPLTLRKGGEPAAGKEESVLSVPFTNGPNSLPIGTVSVGTSETHIRLDLGRPVPVVTQNYAVTFKITKVEALEFDRFTALGLADVAANLALGKFRIDPEFGQLADGKREITRLVVSDVKAE